MTCQFCETDIDGVVLSDGQKYMHRSCYEEWNLAKLAPLRTALMEECDKGCGIGYGTLEAECIEG
jgi:hypothetical protein